MHSSIPLIVPILNQSIDQSINQSINQSADQFNAVHRLENSQPNPLQQPTRESNSPIYQTLNYTNNELT